MSHSQILSELDRLDTEIRSRLVWGALFHKEPEGLEGMRRRRDALERQLRTTGLREPLESVVGALR